MIPAIKSRKSVARDRIRPIGTNDENYHHGDEILPGERTGLRSRLGEDPQDRITDPEYDERADQIG